ncbi:Protein ImuB [Methylobacterium crusticola]|uniref:DNA-directed DNA polymerase n=1 Tax=Methylobacterium crusticola TaxID=1697972 RepID=A0ABQ4R8W1_9HYPH|nr:Protein ImuB [Methylobacterium crusticola]
MAAQGPRRLVAAVDRAARARGLRPGMPVAQAQGMVVDLVLAEAAPDADRAGLTRLSAWCLAYAPLVAPDPPDGIWIEIAGAAHLHGGEAGLVRDLTRRIAAGGFAVRAAVADTPGAAWAVARFGRRRGRDGRDPAREEARGGPDETRGGLVPPGAQGRELAELPLAALRLEAEAVAGLAALGVERVADLAGLARAPVRLRFGGAVLTRLDQALGHAPEPLTYLAPPETLAVRLAFPEPIGGAETLARAVAGLTAALAADLGHRDLGARRLDLVCQRVDGLPQSLSVGLARPSRSPRHLARLFADRLALIDPGYGIEAARLIAARVEPLRARQLAGTAGPAEGGEPEALAELIDRLAVRLGPRRLYRAAPVESEWPERSARRVAPLAPASGLTWPAGLPRPARLLDPPEPVQALALLPDAPPASFAWRRRRCRVARADGPERVFGEWWRSDAEISASRDYYRVEDETGARYWLFRDAPAAEGGRWWLHGLGEA